MSEEKFSKENMPDPNVPVRDIAEITMAHDTINAILLRQVPYHFSSPYEVQILHFYQDVICWVLHHDHKNTFADNLQIMLDNLKAMGYVLQPLPETMTAREVSEMMKEEGSHWSDLVDKAENN